MGSPELFHFASDNTAAICPPAWAALAEANAEAEVSYGDDIWTRRVVSRVREIFERECEVFLIFNGTAANALALAQLCRSYHGVLCHENAHSQTDECGAPEFFSGGAKLIPTPGKNGKLDLVNIQAAMQRYRDVHSPKPRVLSLTQATELGTVYQRAEIETLCAFAREHSMFVHMDGARFANAITALECSPKSITWEAGVDVLCFGGTKNGTAAGELVSKMRFLAAPWVGLLTDNVWIENARHSNRCARLLARKLLSALGTEPVFPCEANAVFLRLAEPLVARLHERGWHFYKFIEPDVYRFMCAWSTTEQQIDEFVADVAKSVAANQNGDRYTA